MCMCSPTRNLAVAIRTRRLLASILRHMARTSVSVSREGAMTGRVNRVIVGLDKYRKNGYICVGIFKIKVFVEPNFRWARSTTAYFTWGILHTWNWMPSSRNISWNCLFKNSLHLSVRTHKGRRRESSSWNVDRYDEAMEGSLVVFTGTRCRNFDNTSMTGGMYYAYHCIFSRSHFHTSITIFTICVFLAICFLTSLWSV